MAAWPAALSSTTGEADAAADVEAVHAQSVHSTHSVRPARVANRPLLTDPDARFAAVPTPAVSKNFHRVVLAVLAGAAGLVLGACGGSGSSSDAKSLLNQTFSGTHAVNSGNLSFSLTVNPSGSSTLRGPITVSFGGPFQSLGKGKLPASNFSISIGALGRSGSLSILSTGANGYVTLQGTSYQLPAATFQKLESSFAGITSSGGGSTGSGALSKLGIKPLQWVSNPSVVGKESVGGVDTTHIRAGIDVSAMLKDISTILQKASTLGVSGASTLQSGIPDATRTRIAATVKNPSFDVWTGNSDKTLRQLTLNLTVPVSGQISTLLGGLRTAQIGMNMKYANLNQPQTITAPTNLRPFSEFTTKLRSFLATVQSAGAAAATGAGSASGAGTTTPGAGAGSSGAGSATPAAPSTQGTNSAVQRYSNCLQAAGQDVAKMQSCQSLLSGQ